MDFSFEQTFPIYDVPDQIDPVLEELIKSRPIQRLKKIHQLGAAHFFRSDWNTKRFEHSVGAMLLLRRHGASLEEQVAGLLHDVSHLAFSHVIDFVFPNKEEDYADRLMSGVVGGGEIGEILRRHGFDPERIKNPHIFPLLEQPRPFICADRFDYSIRDAMSFGLIDLPTARHFHDALCACDETFYFSSLNDAVEFGRLFLMDDYIYASGRCLCLYFMLAEAIRAALDASALKEGDLLGNDEELTNKLYACELPKVANIMSIVRNGFWVHIDKENPQYVSNKKIRYVDPFVQTSGSLKHASELSAVFQRELTEHIADRSLPFCLRVVPL